MAKVKPGKTFWAALNIYVYPTQNYCLRAKSGG